MDEKEKVPRRQPVSNHILQPTLTFAHPPANQKAEDEAAEEPEAETEEK